MNVEERNQDNKALLGFKGSMDLFMGALYTAVAIYVLQFPNVVEQFGHFPVWIFSALFGAYGIFRMYRGWMNIRRVAPRKKRFERH